MGLYCRPNCVSLYTPLMGSLDALAVWVIGSSLALAAVFISPFCL